MKYQPMSTSSEEIIRIFNLQRNNKMTLSISERIEYLEVLKECIEVFEGEIKSALHSDLRKHPIEATLAEVFPLVLEINQAIKHLKKWARPQPAKNNMIFWGSEAWIKKEPWGQCLIISPWNYPIQLPLMHLISSIAAGNKTIIKPSEMAPHSSQLLSEMLSYCFPEEWIAVVNGGVETTTHLLELPFNHIHFTGSTQVGKIVLKAASQHLASCTLELGGKSPLIIDDKYPIDKVVKKIILGKCFNLGQTCIAPDYILVPENRKHELIEALSLALDKTFGENPEQHPHLSRIINQRHFLRLKELYNQVLQDGAQVVHGGAFIEEDLFVTPTILTDVPAHSRILQEEIFGPLIPIVTFRTVMEARDFIQARPKPLALYLFSNDKRWSQYFAQHTSSGALLINDVMIHIMHPKLPFGGANDSGLGYSTGYYGFLNFSHLKPILKVNKYFSPTDIMQFPYSKLLQMCLPLIHKIKL